MPNLPTSTTPPAQAMLLAAGRGQRMRPLTDSTPKPLLPVQGQPLLQWHLQALAAQGFTDVLINTGWLGAQIPAHFGEVFTHSKAPHATPLPDSRLHYSREDVDFAQALETAGGIARALPHLTDVFWLAAGDVFAPDFAFARADYERFAAGPALAHLWLVPNPTHHPAGDFALAPDGLAHPISEANAHWPRYTYSTIGLFKQALFAEPWCAIPAGNPDGIVAPLAPVLRAAMQQGLISASRYTGRWTDVGTPQRLAELNASPLASLHEPR